MSCTYNPDESCIPINPEQMDTNIGLRFISWNANMSFLDALTSLFYVNTDQLKQTRQTNIDTRPKFDIIFLQEININSASRFADTKNIQIITSDEQKIALDPFQNTVFRNNYNIIKGYVVIYGEYYYYVSLEWFLEDDFLFRNERKTERRNYKNICTLFKVSTVLNNSADIDKILQIDVMNADIAKYITNDGENFEAQLGLRPVLVCQLTPVGTSKRINFVNIHNTHYNNAFSFFYQILDKLLKRGNHFLFMGDMNINIAQMKYECPFFEKTKDFGLKFLFNKEGELPTYNNSGLNLDWGISSLDFICNKKGHIITVKQTKIEVRDHNNISGRLIIPKQYFKLAPFQINEMIPMNRRKMSISKQKREFLKNTGSPEESRKKREETSIQRGKSAREKLIESKRKKQINISVNKASRRRVSRRRVSVRRVSSRRVSVRRVSRRRVSRRRVSRRRVSTRKVSRRRVSRRRVSTRKVSRRRVSRRRVSTRKVSRRRVSTRKISRRRVSIRKVSRRRVSPKRRNIITIKY